MSSNQPKKKFKCKDPNCEKKFATQQSLDRHHTAKHSNEEKTFKCNKDNCKKAFFEQWELNNHVKQAHTAKSTEKKFKCKEANCEKAYTTAQALSKHKMTTHSKREKVFKCSEKNCKKAFAQRCLLNNHVKQYHSIYKCTEEGCKYETKTIECFKVHLEKLKQPHFSFSCLGRNSEGEFPQLLDVAEFCPEIQDFFKNNFKWEKARKLFSEIINRKIFTGKAKLYFLCLMTRLRKAQRKAKK